VLFLFALVFPAMAQVRFKLEGKVIDENNQPVAGATVYSKDQLQTGTVSDRQGRFSISLQPGQHTIVCAFMGYKTQENQVEMNAGRDMFFRLQEAAMDIEQVTVTSRSVMERVSNVQIGVEKIEMAEMAKMPALFGERDIIRSIQLLPGIKSDGDGSSGYQVRGGTSAQNLILLDDAPVINAGHLMGIFSPFNDDALATAALYKGQIPAQFGGATSSVFDIQTKTGNMQDYKFNGSVGLLFAKLNIEGPIAKDKASFFVSGRRSYFDMFLKLTEDYKNTTMNFYDLNAKVNYSINENNMLFASFFTGKDNMGLDDLMSMQWGNSASTLRWFHRFNDKLHLNSSLVYSNYATDNGIDVMNTSEDFKGFVRQTGLKESFIWTPGTGHNIKFGVQSTWLDVKSAEWSYSNIHEKEKRNAWENIVWLNEEWKVNEKLELSAGLRLNAFSAMGGSPYYEIDSEGDILETLDYKSGEIVKTYFSLEPRFSMNYRLNERQSIKLGYSRTSQNIHAIRPGTTTLPFDRYAISSNIVKPEKADQVSLGYVTLTRDNKYEFSLEGYYKSVDHIYDFKDGKSFGSEIELERLILGGKGRSYGAEFYARKNFGRLTGWVSYTLSWSENKIPGINNDRWYTAGNDRRHDISIVGMYELKNGWSMAATWVYNTGQALTAPSAKYDLDGETVYYYAERNGYRAPAYHRLDVSFTHTKVKKNHTREWTFGLYNAYCRYNPYLVFFETDDEKPSGTKTVQYSMFGLVPSVSYTIKF